MRIGILTRDDYTLRNWELRIIEHLKNVDALIILGPAGMDKNFKKEIATHAS